MRQEIYVRRMFVLQVALTVGETCVLSCCTNLPSKNWENTKTPLNTRSGPLAKLETWRESRRWSIIGRMAELTSCQYLMHIENGSLRRKQRLCHRSAERRSISESKLLPINYSFRCIMMKYTKSSGSTTSKELFRCEGDIRSLIKMIKIWCSVTRCFV